MVPLLLVLFLARPAIPTAAEAPPGVPNVTGQTVATAKTTLGPNIALKIQDPVFGLREPEASDDPMTIVKQSPKAGHALPNPIPAGYYVAVVIDPGGEGGAMIRIEIACWATFILALMLLLACRKK
jgi:hypothetical protein